MSKLTAPRHGSLGYGPRKRAKRHYASFNTYPKIDETKPLAFAGYKAGMTHVIAIDKHKHGPSYEQKVAIPVTIIEVPPAKVFGIKVYELTNKGLKAFASVIAENIDKELKKKMSIPKKTDNKEKMEHIEKNIERISEVRVLVHTKPTFKKKPEVFEILVNAPDAKEAWQYAKSMLGKEISASQIFKEGDYIDVVAITKGKGIQGPVKRFGARIQYRKAHGFRRHVGCINPWTPTRTMWTALMPGQTGYHRRTVLNLRIIKMGENGQEVTPKGGIPHYGVVKSRYILIKGSLPGPKKRLVMLRFAIRPPKKKEAMPEVVSISTMSQQGRGG